MPQAFALFQAPTTTRLHPLDLAIVALYLAGITAFGLRFRKKGPATGKGSTLQSYFLADNTVPWWAIALSIVSAETSTLTIISVPGIAFGGNFGFLQVVMGYMLGRIVVAVLFLPRYFAGNMLTAYQLIQRRFGSGLHKTTAGLFLLTRAAAEGVRVFAVSIVVGIAIGTGDVASIAIISALTLLYTFEGGMAAVIWTDVVQMAIYIFGTLVAVWSLGHHVAGGWHSILTSASVAHKLQTIDFGASITTAKFWATSYTFWAGILGGGFLTMASHGTDQLMVQRMLAARNLRESRLALLSSGVVVFFQFTLFLLIGIGLWAFYTHPVLLNSMGSALNSTGAALKSTGSALKGTGFSPYVTTTLKSAGALAPEGSAPAHASIANLSPDHLFPFFIVHELPTGIAGLLVAAILAAAMSNLSAALNSLSSSTVVDFYMQFRPAADARERNIISRASTVVWAFILFALAVYSLSVGGKGHVVETGLSIASVAYGALLGVFLLGTLTRFATQAGTIVGMICGFTVNMLLWLPTITPLRTIGGLAIPHIAFTWYVLIGSAVTFLIGATASLILPKPRRIALASASIAAAVLFGLSFPKGICVLHAQAKISVISTEAKRSGETPVFRSALQKSPGAPPVTASSSRVGSMDANPATEPASRYPKPSGLGLTASTKAKGLVTQGFSLGSPLGYAFLNPTETASLAQPSGPWALSPGPSPALDPKPSSSYDFSPVDTLINTAISASKLPGAVVVIGHSGHIVYQHAYGLRKLANEPGLDGKPSPAEPMTEDTIFDMASLTKCLATATAVMQMYEAGKITNFDDPIAKYLPEFLNSPNVSTKTTGASHGASIARTATNTSAEGATVYQPGVERPAGTAEPQVSAPQKSQSPEGATYSASTNPRARVTLRMLLTHTSGEAPDVNLKDPWGLSSPDKAEGIHRALTTPLAGTPGTKFVYSDINFILLGALVEKLSGQPEDIYVATHIFNPLGMKETRYLSFDKVCGLSKDIPIPVRPDFLNIAAKGDPGVEMDCDRVSWTYRNWAERTAPTAHDDESKSNPSANPNFDHLLRAVVHDPTTRRMGGVAGHAGVFSIAHDVSLFAQALLDRLAGRPSNFPLKQSTLELMTTPEQPGHSPTQLSAANKANQAATSEALKSSEPWALGPKPSNSPDPLLAPAYPAIKGQDLRAFGWDIDTAFSKPRGRIFPIGSFGHTGFTGTSLWMDPGSDTYVVLLANAIHPRGGAPISALRGEVATAAAQSLHLYEKPSDTTTSATALKGTGLALKGTGFSPYVKAPQKAGASAPEGAFVKSTANSNSIRSLSNLVILSEAKDLSSSSDAPPKACHLDRSEAEWRDPCISPEAPQKPTLIRAAYSPASRYPKPSGLGLTSDADETGLQPLGYALPQLANNVLVGIDVLEASHAEALHRLGHDPLAVVKVGLLTNQSGLDKDGHRTIDYLASLTTNHLSLTTLFSPEHGISGVHDSEKFNAETDEKTGLHVISLYGAHDSDRRPSHEQLKDLDAVVIDLQDAGVRTYTYPSVVAYFLEASAAEKATYNHDLAIVILDRPNLIDGSDVQGPISNPGEGNRYNNYTPMPIRHGFTLGEFARYVRLEKHVAANLVVVPMRGWQRAEYMDQTGWPADNHWTNPSPNLRNQDAAILLAALTLVETTNVSVGRGTPTPFELFAAGVTPSAIKTSSTPFKDVILTLNGVKGKDPRISPSAPTDACHLDRSAAQWRDPCISPGAPQKPALVQAAYLPSSASRYPKPSGLGLTVTSEEIGALAPEGLSPGSWFKAKEVAAYLTARHIPGVTFEPTTTQVDTDPIHPFHGQTIEAVRLHITDRNALDAPELGIEILAALHHLYPVDFKLARASNMLANKEVLEALTRGDDPRTVAANWQPTLDQFKATRKPYLLY